MSHFEQLVGAFRMCVYICLAAFESKDCNATDQALHDAHDLLMQISDEIERCEGEHGAPVSTALIAQIEANVPDLSYVHFEEDDDYNQDEVDDWEPEPYDYDDGTDEYPDW